MFNMGFTEMVFLAILALIFIGPKQLPELARVLGRFMNEMKRATEDFGSSFTDFKNESQKFLSETESSIENSLRLDEPLPNKQGEANDPPQPGHEHSELSHSVDSTHDKLEEEQEPSESAQASVVQQPEGTHARGSQQMASDQGEAPASEAVSNAENDKASKESNS